MRPMPKLWPAKREKPPRTVYVGSHEDKLSRLAPMRVDPDDDGRTLEDLQKEKPTAAACTAAVRPIGCRTDSAVLPGLGP
jgi:hypothetical protein